MQFTLPHISSSVLESGKLNKTQRIFEKSLENLLKRSQDQCSAGKFDHDWMCLGRISIANAFNKRLHLK